MSNTESKLIPLEVEVYAKNILWSCEIECRFDRELMRVEYFNLHLFKQAEHEADEFAPIIAYALECMVGGGGSNLFSKKGLEIYYDLRREIEAEVGKLELANMCIDRINGQIADEAAQEALECRNSCPDCGDEYYG